MGPTILIIDDSESVRQHVSKVLRERGVASTFLMAGDGIDGFKLLLTHQVSLALCDIMMPGFDGFKFLSLKQSKAELAEMPVIMLTGSDDVKSKVKGLEAGASDYLIKPIADEELVARVRVHLKIKALQDELREKNQRLEELSRTDGLTKINNRRYLIELFELEYLRSERYGQPLSYIMVDLDHFKALNDSEGHQAGDLALVEVASVLRRNLRINDVVGRYGGEEFGIILPQTDAAGAMMVAERCRADIENMSISVGEKVIRMTASLGVGYRPHPRAADMAALIRLADDALYDAKKNGRNRVVLAPNS